MRTWLALALAVALAAGEAPPPVRDIALQAPIATLVELPDGHPGGEAELVATIEVPVGAPADLGVGAWVADRHGGRWFQRARAGSLPPGRHELVFGLATADPLLPEGHAAAWNAAAAALARRTGLFFWSAATDRSVIRVLRLALRPCQPPATGDPRLILLAAPARAATGRRWELHARPDPYPANPDDPEQFALSAQVAAPDGRVLQLLGFHDQPMRSTDAGDRELVLPAAPAAFALRLRSGQPGSHRIGLRARWAAAGVAGMSLDLPVEGAAWDGWIRTDRDDSRFLTRGGAFFWPYGPNLKGVYDRRCAAQLNTRLTPARGSLAYRGFLERFAGGGATGTEVWLAAWNLAPEWTAAWPEYHGIGRFSEENAWRLDRLLDDAERLGIAVNLVINNHGQASRKNDREWAFNPWNTANGGPLPDALSVFTNPLAIAGQERVRRHLAARHADSPAVLAWKLWSEIDLTAAQDDHDARRSWHREAARRWRTLDPYGHPVTTHWSGNYRRPDRDLIAGAGLDLVCIDAYHNEQAELWRLLNASTRDPDDREARGLAKLGRPVLATEYGGTSQACPDAQMRAEHAYGAWVALVSGHAGGPFLWWHEWIDQGGHFAPYGAIARFLAGEDLRDPQAACMAIPATAPGARLWARAWVGSGRMLGHCLDLAWAAKGGDQGRIADARLRLFDALAPGDLELAWWDADHGSELSRTSIAHPGGPLEVAAPAFTGQLAWKLRRPPPP